jgi:hypothetical protein
MDYLFIYFFTSCVTALAAFDVLTLPRILSPQNSPLDQQSRYCKSRAKRLTIFNQKRVGSLGDVTGHSGM